MALTRHFLIFLNKKYYTKSSFHNKNVLRGDYMLKKRHIGGKIAL